MAPNHRNLFRKEMAPNQTYLFRKENPFMTCILDLRSGSSCKKTVSKVLGKCQGMVHNFRMDGDTVEISGTIDPEMLLKALANVGSKAEIRWLQFGECSNNLFMPGPTGRYLEPAKPRPDPLPVPRKPENAHAVCQIGYPQYNNNNYSNYYNYDYQQSYDNYAQYYNANNNYQQQLQSYEQQQYEQQLQSYEQQQQSYEQKQQQSYEQKQQQSYEQKQVQVQDDYETEKRQDDAYERRQKDVCVIM